MLLSSKEVGKVSPVYHLKIAPDESPYHVVKSYDSVIVSLELWIKWD